MRTTIYKLYANFTSSQNGLASLTIPRGGRITAITGRLRVVGPANAAQVLAELSFLPTAQATVNDARGVLAEVGYSFAMTTSGASPTDEHVVLTGIAIPVNVGDRLYVNTTVSGSVSSGTSVAYFVYVTE